MYADVRVEPDKNCHWFYCDENYVYFSERKNSLNNESKEEIDVKNEQRINAYNSDEKDLKYIMPKTPCKRIRSPDPESGEVWKWIVNSGACSFLLHV